MKKQLLSALAALSLVGSVYSVAQAAPAPKATLPLVVYGTGSPSSLPYIASGYMGNTGSIKMDDQSATDPHSGKTCMKVDYTATDNWGGVDWQSPANDWGDQPGGWNLTGAKKLTFWARGSKGGEIVTFMYGGLTGKTYSDTASDKLDKVTLTKAWKQYTLDLTGKDLSDIKTGFGWVVAGSGQPITFYLDDIKYQ